MATVLLLVPKLLLPVELLLAPSPFAIEPRSSSLPQASLTPCTFCHPPAACVNQPASHRFSYQRRSSMLNSCWFPHRFLIPKRLLAPSNIASWHHCLCVFQLVLLAPPSISGSSVVIEMLLPSPGQLTLGRARRNQTT